MIKGFRGTSLVDYPGRVAAVVYLGGCNLRCPYCYNVDLVLPDRVKALPDIAVEDVVKELNKRRGFIDAIVVTGGEPLLHPDLTKRLCLEARALGLLAKVDTNGSYPERLKELLGVVDYVALDVKTSPDRYHLLRGSWEPVEGSIDLLKSWSGEYEIRITAVPPLVDEDSLLALLPVLDGVKRVAIQKFIPNWGTLDPSYGTIHPYTREEMEKLARILKGRVGEVIIR